MAKTRTSSKFSFARTRRLVALVVNPHPRIHTSQLGPASTRTRGSVVTARVGRIQHHDGPPVYTTIQAISVAPAGTGPERSTATGVEEHNIRPDSQSTTTTTTTTLPTSSHILRSSRRRKCKSINDADVGLVNLKDDLKALHRSTYPRTGGSMSTILSLSRSSSYSLSSQVVRRGTVHRRNLHRGHARLVQVQPEQNYSDYTTSTDSSAYVTAATHLDESSTSHVSVDECILQAIDTSSGAAFDTIHLRSLGEIDLHSLDLGAQRTDSTYPPVTRNSWSSQIPPWKIGQDVQVSEIPTLILTEPTPMIPQSPVFIPQSPITVQQFFSAAASTGPRRVPAETKLRRPGPTHTSPSGYLAPSLTSCSDCGLVEFDQGLQCQKCNRRRLACKVWYDRATDGGQRRRWLTEPYIRPGKCNETNREIPTTRDLTIFGYPAALCSSDYRLGRTPDAPYPRQRIVWDIWKTIKRRLVQARQKLAIQRSVSSVRQTLDASAKPLRHHLRSPVPFKPVVV